MSQAGIGQQLSLTYDSIAMIGTSDQSCWLAEACKILLLLLVP